MAFRSCRTEVVKTHITERRQVVYAWHPWQGRHVQVQASLTRLGAAVLHCRVEGGQPPIALEIPAWMFDSAFCAGLAMAAEPRADWRALSALRSLLDDACATGGVLEDTRLSQREKGDGEAKIEGGTGAAGPVPSGAEGSAVADAAGGSQAACGGAAGAADAGRRGGGPGGGR